MAPWSSARKAGLLPPESPTSGSPSLAPSGASCLARGFCAHVPPSPQSSGGRKTLEASHCCVAQGMARAWVPPGNFQKWGSQSECPRSAQQESETPHVFLPPHPVRMVLCPLPTGGSPHTSCPPGAPSWPPSPPNPDFSFRRLPEQPLWFQHHPHHTPAWHGFALGCPCGRRPGGGAGVPQGTETHQACGFLFTSPRCRLHWEWGLRW